MQEVKFETLVTSIGISLQNAQKTIENQNTTLYFQDYEVQDENVYTPVTRRISMPGSDPANAGIIDVPLTALQNHSSLMLDSVDINLKFVAGERNGDLCLGIKSAHEPDELQNEYSEMSLHFKKADTSEGIARLTDKAIKQL